MEIFFDDWEAREGSIADDVAALLEWTKPTSASIKKRKPEPPILTFDWGANPALGDFRGYLKSVSARYTHFDRDGNPLRVSANVTLEEVPTDPKKQNPTSGGRHGYRTHIMREGESLQSVAYAEWGDPGLWRALAIYNELDDPLRVSPSTSLLVPEIATAERLASR